MAPRVQFGNTDWGKVVKQKLESITPAGRLERGLTLARTGKVYDTRITENSISTKVKGKSSPYYNVSSTWTKLSSADHDIIVSTVKNDPLILGQVLSGTLPISLLDALTKRNIHLLPQTCSELNTSCNCPDAGGAGGGGGYWGGSSLQAGELCKHQAALMFQIIAEIDQNPYILFQLRGLKLLEKVGDGTVAAGAQDIPYPFATPVFEASEAKGNNETVLSAPAAVTFPKLNRTDGFVLSCLTKSPIFAPSLDFRDVLKQLYDHLHSKKGLTALQKDLPWEASLSEDVNVGGGGSRLDALSALLSHSTMKVELPASFALGSASVTIHSTTLEGESGQEFHSQLFPAGGVKAEAVPGGGVRIPFASAVRLLERLPTPATNASPSYRFFYYAARASALLLDKGAFAPEVIPGPAPADTNTARMWRILYRPLPCNDGVRGLLQNLSTLHPIAAPTIMLTPASSSAGGTSAQAPTALAPESAVQHILSGFLTVLVHRSEFMHKKAGKVPPPISAAFFSGSVFVPVALSDKSTGSAVRSWLGVFDMLRCEVDVQLSLSARGCPAVMETETDTINDDNSKPPTPPPPLSAEFTLRVLFQSKTPADVQKSGDNKKSADTKKSDDSGSAFVPPSVFFAGGLGGKDQQSALRFLSALSKYLPQPEALAKNGAVPLSRQQLEDLLCNTGTVLKGLGVKLLLPRGMGRLLKPRVVNCVNRIGGEDDEHSDGVVQGYMRLEDTLRFHVGIAVGDSMASIEEFEELVARGERVTLFKGNYVEIDPGDAVELLADARKKAAAGAKSKPSPLELVQAHITNAQNMFLDKPAKAVLDKLLEVENHAQPLGMNPNYCLRDYQDAGFRWLASTATKMGGCVLADDMGLGKTLQTLTLLQHMKEKNMLAGKPALIVAPVSLLVNWASEAARFTSDLSVAKYYGADRTLEGLVETGGSNKRRKVDPSAGGANVILTSYATVLRDANILNKVQWGALILDEAQNIKNVQSATAVAIKALGKNVSVRVALTGTPVENRLTELWSIFDFVLPNLLGKQKDFLEAYAKPIERKRDEAALERLRMLTGPFMLRRLKVDLLKELPEKVELVQSINLSPAQAALYSRVVEETMAEIERIKESEEKGGRGMILKLITALKQICDHPTLFTNRISNKMQTDESEEEGSGSEEEEQGDDATVEPISDMKLSGKVVRLLELLAPIMESGEKVLIFTQYVGMLTILQQLLTQHFLQRPLVYEGSMKSSEREAVLDDFKTDPLQQILILSLKAGGVGLNLTAANHVIHFDRWWNPAVENQASDRVYRIGQQRCVVVHKFVCAGTFEERVADMLQKKKELSDLTVQTGESWISDLEPAKLRELFALSADVGAAGMDYGC